MSGLVHPIKEALKTTLRPLRQRLQNMNYRRRINSEIRSVESAYVDPRIRYPSYKSLDEFIDVAALKSLDGYIRERLSNRGKDNEFWTGPYTRSRSDNQNPGSQVIFLAERTAAEHDYFHLDQPGLWKNSEAAEDFAEVMAFIQTLPFKSTGRMMIMYDFNSRPVTAHRDHFKTDLCSEFIWFRTNFVKPFYMMNSSTGERKYVEGHTAWFDTVNQFHGADAADGLSISLRVDGKFTDEFKARIPKPERTAASTPSYWAAVSDAH
jgi:hypothetical protein